MKRILLLDNYDSFTFNLEHYLVSLGVCVDVVRNDEQISNFSGYNGVVLSPGPGLPADAGMLMEVIGKIQGVVPVLGVCLGMQAIGEYLGAELYNQEEVKHGVQEQIVISGGALFEGLASEISVGLYHSWAVRDCDEFNVVAKTKEGVLMAIEEPERRLYGVQFHPESIMTTDGMKIVKNFVDLL